MLINSLRPKKLDNVIGQDEIVLSIKKQFDCGRIPNFFIIYGVSGTGKTTLSRIIALMLQKAPEGAPISRYDIKEINAADKNGIDDVRSLIDNSTYKPYAPSIAKVVIMDEAHQLTTQAQNTLLKLTEDPPKYMYYIFCTTNLVKIIAALKRRAYIINTKGINKESTMKLLRYANGYNLYTKEATSSIQWDTLNESEKELYSKKADSVLNMIPLCDSLIKYDIDSPGLILQAVEKYINGSDPDDSIFNTSNNALDTFKLCNLVSKGDWKSSANIMASMKKEDIFMVRNCVLGYLKTILLRSESEKALNISKAIKTISEYCDELPTFLAYVCIACEYLKK